MRERSHSKRLLSGFLWPGFLMAIAHICLFRPAAGTVHPVPEEYPTIQAAIDHSVNGDTVLVAPGTYRGPGNRDIEFRGIEVVVTSREGPEETIIDCENAGRGFYVHDWEGRAARIEGFTIENGDATALSVNDGGGILCDVASPTISRCVISNCRADEGGGLALLLFGGVLDWCTIHGCRADRFGGGVVVQWSAGVTITNSTLSGNEARAGGAISYETDIGGHVLRGCTITANRASNHGGGVFTSQEIYVDRCVLWGNCAPTGHEIHSNFSGASFTCSDVDTTGVASGSGSYDYDQYCVYTDPLFCGPVDCGQTTGGDWWLSSDSPCLPEHSPCGHLIGALGLGCGPSAPLGACCLADGSCVYVTAEECRGQNGSYQGDHVPCAPGLCQPTPVESSTWGRIKARFRE